MNQSEKYLKSLEELSKPKQSKKKKNHISKDIPYSWSDVILGGLGVLLLFSQFELWRDDKYGSGIKRKKEGFFF
tara:strand:+ start:191 stop:412 length:222 start_codon:yes stop_codon:yes gene_type:complete